MIETELICFFSVINHQYCIWKNLIKMMSLNFQAEKHEKLIVARKKKCTVRLGDVSDKYPEGSIVWITSGKKFTPKKHLYTAYLDKVRVKTMENLTSEDLGQQNPEINSREELIADFERIYKKRISMDDTVTVIYFTEVFGG